MYGTAPKGAWSARPTSRPESISSLCSKGCAAVYVDRLTQQVAPDVLMRIAEIVHYMQQREYRMANDSYLQLSIGNAPWPIGVTAVGCVAHLTAVSTSAPDKKSCIQPTLLMVCHY